VIEETGLDWKAVRRHYYAPGPEGWVYVVERPYGRWSKWHAVAGGAFTYPVDLGDWPRFALAAAACEAHAIKARTR
jgi:hypothetical protein